MTLLPTLVGTYTPLTPERVGQGTNDRVLIGRCPLCGSPDYPHVTTLAVFLDSDSWHCYRCEKGGDVFTFLMLVERLSFRDALERLGTLITRQPDYPIQTLSPLVVEHLPDTRRN